MVNPGAVLIRLPNCGPGVPRASLPALRDLRLENQS